MYKLCSISLEECEAHFLEIDQQIDGRFAAPHSVQLRLCREFLLHFENYGVLVSPQRDSKQIMIVAQKDFLSTEAFRKWISKECLKVTQSSRTDNLSLEECLRFSIVVWLERFRFYRCGKDLVYGSLFDAKTPQTVRILFAVYCTSSGEIFLRATAETVRLFTLETWKIGDESAEQRWVFCLPKLGRGQLVGKHSGLPHDCGFATYGQMRAYWKNCHGYELPMKEPESYYDVRFNGLNASFVYPDFCIMSAMPVPIRFRDEYDVTHSALDNFVSAFTSSDYSICGKKVQLSRVDPSFISLSVQSTGRRSRRRKISFKEVLTRSVVKIDELKKDRFVTSESINSTDEHDEACSSINSMPGRAATDFSQGIGPVQIPTKLVTAKFAPSGKRKISIE